MTLSSNFALKRGGGGRNNEGGVTTREYGTVEVNKKLSAFDHRACCALFEDYGVSFTGVRMSAVAFTPRALKR